MSTSTNLYRALMDLLPDAPLQVATVVSINASAGISSVTWPGGSQQIVRGASGSIGSQVFVRNGLIEGPAPALTFVTIEV